MGFDDHWVARALVNVNLAAELLLSMRGHIIPPPPPTVSSPPSIHSQRKRPRSRMITLLGFHEAWMEGNDTAVNRIPGAPLSVFTEKGSTSSKRPKKECHPAPTLVERGYCKAIANEPLKLRIKLPKPVLQQPGKRANELNLPPLISSLPSKTTMKPISSDGETSEMNPLQMVPSSGGRDGLILDLNELPPIEDDDVVVEKVLMPIQGD